VQRLERRCRAGHLYEAYESVPAQTKGISEAIRVTQRHLLAIRVTQKHSEAIRGNQRGLPAPPVVGDVLDGAEVSAQCMQLCLTNHLGDSGDKEGIPRPTRLVHCRGQRPTLTCGERGDGAVVSTCMPGDPVL
jgi:hypothetical protein